MVRLWNGERPNGDYGNGEGPWNGEGLWSERLCNGKTIEWWETIDQRAVDQWANGANKIVKPELTNQSLHKMLGPSLEHYPRLFIDLLHLVERSNLQALECKIWNPDLQTALCIILLGISNLIWSTRSLITAYSLVSTGYQRCSSIPVRRPTVIRLPRAQWWIFFSSVGYSE